MRNIKIFQKLGLTVFLLLGAQLSLPTAYAQNNDQKQKIAGIWRETILEDKTKELPMPKFISTIELKDNGEAILKKIKISEKNVIELAKGNWTWKTKSLDLIYNTEIIIKLTEIEEIEEGGIATAKLIEVEEKPNSGIFTMLAFGDNNQEIRINPPLYLIKDSIPTKINLEGFTVERVPQQNEFPNSGASTLGILATVLFFILVWLDIIFSQVRSIALSQSLIRKDVEPKEEVLHRSHKYKSPGVFLITALYTIGWTLMFYIYINNNEALPLLNGNSTLGYLLLLIPIMGLWFFTIKNYLITIDISARQLHIWSPLEGNLDIEFSDILTIAPKRLGVILRPTRGIQLHYKTKGNEEKSLKLPLMGFKNPNSLLRELKNRVESITGVKPPTRY